MGDEARGIPECPLVFCIFDDPVGRYQDKMHTTAREMQRLTEEGISVADLALRFALTQRTVYRYLAMVKKSQLLST